MNLPRIPAKALAALTATGALFTGCTIAPSVGEKQTQTSVAQIGEVLRPVHGKPALPELTANSRLDDYMRFAVVNHPAVQAAYQDWRASVAAIAPTRALPDPQFTFEADIVDTLMTFMPGVMFDFMTPGKRRAMAREMTATSAVAYRSYVAEVLKAAANTRRAWIELAFINESMRLQESSIAALESSLEIANTDYTTGRGMGTLANQIKVTNDIARVRSELATLADRRTAARVRFKSALGITATDHDPAWPQVSLASTALPSEDELWRRASAFNAELGRMRAMVDMAIASIEVARRARTPDFTVGAMADLKADPLMFRPTATLTLPVWREKIAANIAAAEARRDAGVARVGAEQLNLAAEVAQMLFMVREADRMIAFIDTTALPNFDRAIETVAAGYQSGMTSPGMIPETQLMALNMRLERVTALRDRELAATDLLLMTADIAPSGAPLLVTVATQP